MRHLVDPKTNLKNLTAIFNGKVATNNVDKVFFVPRVIYENGDHTGKGRDYITRTEFNRMTAKNVKRLYIELHPHSYLVW